MTVFEDRRAGEAEIAERNGLAGRVAEALAAAGFAVHRDADDGLAPLGARVSVDPGNDSRGGVFVQWATDLALVPDARQDVRAVDFASPEFRHFRFVTEHMHATLVAVLGSAGFRAEAAGDDMNPYLVHVTG
ncbi:hypothetical protein ACN20G_07275 [Streptomyces sp. BI20]|uniref:hypothetical protein n=1 Tax=Streptomyces sp. BI20 TaxID=3403460 RepID=UPI003C725019